MKRAIDDRPVGDRLADETIALVRDRISLAELVLERGIALHPTGRARIMRGLRNSGELEQEADIVILLHRNDYYDKECSRAGEADLIIAKHRNGPTETVSVAAQLHHARFVDFVA